MLSSTKFLVMKHSFAVLQAMGGCSSSEGKSIKCQECSKECFGRNRKQDMARHMITHSKNRPLTCDKCPYRAATFTQLYRHTTLTHGLTLTPQFL